MEGTPDQDGTQRSREAFTSGLGGHHILRPVPTSQKETYGQGTKQLEGSLEEREDERGDRDRGVRGSIASASWEENAHARSSESRETRRVESSAG
jgi:hypothetical protein